MQFKTILRRLDAKGNGAAVNIPAVREGDFRSGRLVIRSVPFVDPFRVTLRVWTERKHPQSIVITLNDAAGNAFASKRVLLDGRGTAELIDVVHDFGNVPQRREPVNLTIDADGSKVWAFVSAINPNVAAPALHYPQ